ncbi:hypothetical protein [Paraflavitalea speifideaquila]|uniref:hypothetical protein n=1 Tax=Paraflavitalea speifideaquila TaxID=3076558 RepID=UPI0028ED860E|nr:hypothetical protein [Paraflavitalea speifideiaquila]
MTIVSLAFCQWPAIGQQQEVIRDRLSSIQRGLDTMIFVNRFESIESSCLYIASWDSSIACAERAVINSNYRIKLAKGKEIDTNGVKCLSQHVARYLRLRVKVVDTTDLCLAGVVETTYAYPASSIIQLLGATRQLEGKTDRYFDKLIKFTGTFTLYPADDKYRIKMILNDLPFDPGDAYFGYLEIVLDAFKPHAEKVYLLRFDQMSIKKGIAITR